MMEPTLPAPEDIDGWAQRKYGRRPRKPRYYTTPYWPCPINKCRMRYLYFSSKTGLEHFENIVNYHVTATLRPVKWCLIVKYKRKRNPVPEHLRNTLCVYADARHIGHVEYVGEETTTLGEIEYNADALYELKLGKTPLYSLARKVITGWKHEPTPATPAKLIRFKWLDYATAVAIGHMKKVKYEDFAIN